MAQRRSSSQALSRGVPTPVGFYDVPVEGGPGTPASFNPYSDYLVAPGAAEGYVAARTSSPPPENTHSRDGSASTGNPGHAVFNSLDSREPLMSGYLAGRSTPPPGYLAHGAGPSTPPSVPPRNPQRLTDAPGSPTPQRATAIPVSQSRTSSVYSEDSFADNVLNLGLRTRINPDNGSVYTSTLRDEEGFTGPVLGVRNLPDRENSRESV